MSTPREERLAKPPRQERVERPQEYYDQIKERFAAERDLRLAYRPEGTAQFITDLGGPLAQYETDPYGGPVIERDAIDDTVEVLFIGGGFSALLTSARLREKGVESIRIVEKGGDVGGTWYWNRYPGVACDVVSYDYLPLLDEMGYVPSRHYAPGSEILAHCQAIAERYDLYELAVFQTTVTSTIWDEAEKLWHVATDRGDHMRARFVVCANGTLTKPKLARIQGMDRFQGHSFHTSRWDYDYTGQDLENLHDKVVGIIGTGATAVQAVPGLGANAKELYVFQRTPSSIDVRDDWETDPEWAATLEPGWQAERRAKMFTEPPLTAIQIEKRASMTREDKIRAQENANIDYMMRIHRRIEEHRRGPGDGGRVEALVHVHVQAAVLPQRLPAHLQPARPSIWSTPTARASPRSPRTARSSRVACTRSTSSSTPPASRCRRPGRGTRSWASTASTSRTSTPRASAPCSGSTPTASRTCSSWVATRPPSTST